MRDCILYFKIRRRSGIWRGVKFYFGFCFFLYEVVVSTETHDLDCSKTNMWVSAKEIMNITMFSSFLCPQSIKQKNRGDCVSRVVNFPPSGKWLKLKDQASSKSKHFLSWTVNTKDLSNTKYLAALSNQQTSTHSWLFVTK